MRFWFKDGTLNRMFHLVAFDLFFRLDEVQAENDDQTGHEDGDDDDSQHGVGVASFR